MTFDMNYVFWVDTSNVFTAALTAAWDYEIREKSMTIKYPQLEQSKIVSHKLTNDGSYNPKGGLGNLWGQVKTALSKGWDIYSIIKPFLVPALSAASPMLGGALGLLTA